MMNKTSSFLVIIWLVIVAICALILMAYFEKDYDDILNTPSVVYAEVTPDPIEISIDKPVEKLVIMSDLPQVLQDISWCESSNRQFNDDGSVKHGIINPKDIGQWQINEYWNGEEAKRLGFDIYTQQGNKDMALHLYNTQGTSPWNASQPCWSDIEAWKKNSRKSYY
jgi:hypothetical protein